MSPPLRKQEIASMKRRSNCFGKCLPLGDESTLAFALAKFNCCLHFSKKRDTSDGDVGSGKPWKIVTPAYRKVLKTRRNRLNGYIKPHLYS